MLESKKVFLTAFIIALLLPVFVLFGCGEARCASTPSSSAPVSLWVASNNDRNGGTVSEINSATGIVLRTITVGYFPDAIKVDSSGNVWVANFGCNTVSEISRPRETVRTIPVGPNPIAMAVDSSGNVWVANHASSTCNGHMCFTISEINGSTGTVLRSITVGQSPQAVAADSSGNVWLAIGGGKDNGYLHVRGKVLEINSATGIVSRTVDVGYSPNGIAVDSSGNVWVADYYGATVSEINGSTGTVSRTITVRRFPQAIAADSSGNQWVANDGGTTVSEINGSTGTVSHTIEVKGIPSAIAVDSSGNVYSLVHSLISTLSEINGSTSALSRTIATASNGQDQLAIAVGPADNWGGGYGIAANLFGHTYVPADGSACWVFHKNWKVALSDKKGHHLTGTYSVAAKTITVDVPGAFQAMVLRVDNKGCIYNPQQPGQGKLCRLTSETSPCQAATHGAKPREAVYKAREAAQEQEKAAAIAAGKRKAALKRVPTF